MYRLPAYYFANLIVQFSVNTPLLMCYVLILQYIQQWEGGLGVYMITGVLLQLGKQHVGWNRSASHLLTTFFFPLPSLFPRGSIQIQASSL
jgi:hypothetical protein